MRTNDIRRQLSNIENMLEIKQNLIKDCYGMLEDLYIESKDEKVKDKLGDIMRLLEQV